MWGPFLIDTTGTIRHTAFNFMLVFHFGIHAHIVFLEQHWELNRLTILSMYSSLEK